MDMTIPLSKTKEGSKSTVIKLCSKGVMRRRFQDIGITEGTRIECIKKSPLGDPCAYLIGGTLIAIRNDDAKDIIVKVGR